MKLRYGVLAAAIAVSGCSMMHSDATIGRLSSAKKLDLQDVPVPVEMHDQIREDYRSLLSLVEEPGLKKAIERRIADIYMMEGDFKQVQGVPEPKDGYYGEAIKSYKDVLAKYPGDPKNDEVLYQLAKAYELEQNDEKALQTLQQFIGQYPQSPRLAEVYFRKGDIHFKNEDYEPAEAAYENVVALNVKDSPFTNNAIYLMGWSRYKLSDYEGGLQAFNQVLDSIVPANGKLEGLSNVDRSLADDTLRIMSLSLSYSGGAAKLNEMYAGQKPRYAYMLYSSLGTLYLSKERYEDSAAAFRSFVDQDPTSDLAPQMHAKMIRAYIEGDFPQQVIPEKERYVANYGIHSKFWKEKPMDVKREVIPNLKVYIDELARHYHGTGQRQAKSDKAAESTKAVASFQKASGYYAEFVDTFPKDPKVPEMVFMGGEAAFDGQNYPLAIKLYEQTAYQFKDPKRGPDSGYAAIVAYQKHTATMEKKFGKESPELKDWYQRAVDSKLRFVGAFPTDTRASAVMGSVAEELIALKQYDKAIEAATSIVNRPGKMDPALGKMAYGVIGLSNFELGKLDLAEKAYVDQLKFVTDAKDRKTINDKIAIVIYKQGEADIKANQLESGIAHFLRIKQYAPNSEIRVNAQYDAATHLLALDEFGKAIEVLREIQQLFPNHRLMVEVPRKLAYAYQADEQYAKAAQEYLALYHNDKDPVVQREALFTAAELNMKLSNNDLAIDQFKTWAHQYEQPFDDRMEARYNLARLYEIEKDMNRHLYWLRRIIDGDKDGGKQRTERSRYMGAWANAKYGDYWTWEFNNVRLKAPLQANLPRKNEKLQNAQKRYEAAAEYGFSEFAAKASYSIANLYYNFSKELMNAPRPKGLSAVEAEQYQMLLEDEALPFEELALDIHQKNIERSWDGEYNQWIGKSFGAMAKINPIRYGKQEIKVAYEQSIY